MGPSGVQQLLQPTGPLAGAFWGSTTHCDHRPGPQAACMVAAPAACEGRGVGEWEAHDLAPWTWGGGPPDGSAGFSGDWVADTCPTFCICIHHGWDGAGSHMAIWQARSHASPHTSVFNCCWCHCHACCLVGQRQRCRGEAHDPYGHAASCLIPAAAAAQTEGGTEQALCTSASTCCWCCCVCCLEGWPNGCSGLQSPRVYQPRG